MEFPIEMAWLSYVAEFVNGIACGSVKAVAEQLDISGRRDPPQVGAKVGYVDVTGRVCGNATRSALRWQFCRQSQGGDYGI